ncbi:exonuclease subunit SbcD [Zoogloea sp.]|uniref:exonuclease subunit SbcD n=1 Tax=Zoogloea sp. TaxID=49181 RepID=UPI002605797A|nr:exonuclease subunit SbcD [Zoogloea sp.]MDD3352033.1 exonuclease subunit SbcD [Zoogloea sp.]
MRILHTSDWHLGQHFMGKSRQAEHQALIDWLLVQVNTHQVDAVLIAGDLFDTGSPPSYARELYNQLVLRLHQVGVALLLLGGNHDSVAVLAESRALLARLGATVIAAAGAPADHVCVLPRRDGTPGCVVCAIPFIRPRDVVSSQAGESAEDKRQALLSALQAHYDAVHELALARQTALAAELGRTLPILATGHLTTVGASASESVREIYVGSLEAFPTSAFPPVAYIALGHIHRPQAVGGLEHVRYSGSPLPLSFDEASQDKEVLRVDFEEDRLTAVTPLAIPRFQPLVSLEGSLSTLPAQLQASASGGSGARPVWLEITVREDDYLADLPARIDALTSGLPVEVLRIRRARGASTPHLEARTQETLHELSPTEVFQRRLAQEQLDEPVQSALNTRYQRILTSLEEDPA